MLARNPLIANALAAALLLTALATPALPQDLVAWDSTAGWDVLIDPSLGNGCLIQSEFTDGSVVRIGFDLTEAMGYVTAFNEAWGAIEADKLYPVSFTLDSEEYEAEAKGIYLDGVPGADIYFDNEDFLFDIAARQTMTLSHEGAEVMSIDLTGSAAALTEAIACQEAQG